MGVQKNILTYRMFIAHPATEIPECVIGKLTFSDYNILNERFRHTGIILWLNSTTQEGRKTMCLETERLILRDYVESDREDYYRLKNDSETMYYLQDIKLSSRQEVDEEFEQVLEDAKKADRTFYFLP